MLANVAPVQVVFSGLVSSPTWLVFSGLVIGAALKRNGLGDWVAVRLAEKMAGTYRREVVGMVLFGLISAFFVPSAMGRMVLILPILVALAQQLGYREGSREFFGIVLAGVMGSYLPSYGILTANVPNMVLAGVVEKTFGISTRYADYLLLHFPVLGFLKAVVLDGRPVRNIWRETREGINASNSSASTNVGQREASCRRSVPGAGHVGHG